MDVAWAFRNLRADPREALKFGIIWGYDYYIDLIIAFGWSAAFQGTSEWQKVHKLGLCGHVRDLKVTLKIKAIQTTNFS